MNRWSRISLFLISLILVTDGVWSIVVQLGEPFIPFQLGRLVRIAIGIYLSWTAWRMDR